MTVSTLSARLSEIRFAGGGTRPRSAPFGATWSDTAQAIAIQVDGEDAMDAIPEATTLPAGTIVIILPDASRGRGILAAFGRKPIARSARCAALLLRGYVEIAAEVDPASRLDLVHARF